MVSHRFEELHVRKKRWQRKGLPCVFLPATVSCQLATFLVAGLKSDVKKVTPMSQSFIDQSSSTVYNGNQSYWPILCVNEFRINKHTCNI